MKRNFVLDENILIFAERLRDESDNFNFMSLKVVTDIIHDCHTLVVDSILQEKYNRIFKSMELNSRGASGPVVTRMMTQIQYHKPKYHLIEHIPRLEEEEALPDDDVPLVRLVVAARGVLVTRDRRLVESVKELDLQRKYGFAIGSPEEVFTLFFHDALG